MSKVSDQVKRIHVENGYLLINKPVYYSPTEKIVVKTLEQAAALAKMNPKFGDFEKIQEIELVNAEWAFEEANGKEDEPDASA